MEAKTPSDQKHLTREEAIAAIRQLADDLGRVPKKSDLPEDLRNRIRVLFEKWCYALEASGLVVPSEKVQEKRRKREAHKAAVAARAAKREAKKKEQRRDRKSHTSPQKQHEQD